MIYLENRSIKGLFLKYSHDDNLFQFTGHGASDIKISGYFDYCEGHFMAFYKYDMKLYIICDDIKILFSGNLQLSLIDEIGSHRTTLEEEKKKRFIVRENGEEKINILYPKLKINNDLDDWVQPVCDIELFDYCYWIYNVWKNDRMGTLLEVWI